MSSMRNVNQHRKHRERGQPLERETRLGFLEKHKDYSLRSKNHNDNKKRLRILRQKAAERNPDEFFYGMLSGQSRKGRKLAGRQNPVLSQDVVKILKTQDAGYVNTILQKTKQARVRLEQEFVLNDDQSAELLGPPSRQDKGSHKIFMNGGEKRKEARSDSKLAFPPDPISRNMLNTLFEEESDLDGRSLVNWPNETSKLRRASEYQELASEQHQRLRKQHRKEQSVRKSKLAALNAREKDLMKAKIELDVQRATMSNGIGGITKREANWKAKGRKT